MGIPDIQTIYSPKTKIHSVQIVAPTNDYDFFIIN